jgi:hypothetical protein
MHEPDSHPKRQVAMAHSYSQRWLKGICLLGGLLLTVIGIRFLLVPESAARTFGIATPPAGHEMHYIIGLRDIWLGLLAAALAALHEWRAVMIWSGMGAVVCFADAGIAGMSSGKLPQVAFHFGSGIVCIAVTLFILRLRRNET